jgi:hypothetical protein
MSISVRIVSTRLMAISRPSSLLKGKGKLVRLLFSSPLPLPSLPQLSLIHLQVLHAFRSVFVVSILVFIHTHTLLLFETGICFSGMLCRGFWFYGPLPAANRLWFETLSRHVICFDAIHHKRL